MFRILSFTIHKHPLLGGKTFELTNPKEFKTPNYYSVIIGPNGTGKSFLLNNLVEALNELVILIKDTNYKSKRKFTLKYQLNNTEYEISTKDRDTIYLKNDKPVSRDKVEMPSKWIASSVTINDKYPILNYIRKIQIPQYKYLGIRSASNNAFISRITINTVLYFIQALKKNKGNQLLDVYQSLGLNTEVQIVFSGGPMLKLKKYEGKYTIYRNVTNLTESHNSFIKNNKSKTNYRADNYKKHLEKSVNINSVFEFMRLNHTIFEKSGKSAMQFIYKVDLFDGSGIDNLIEDWEILSIMLDLELIKINKFNIKKDSAFKYEDASSGESHLLTSLHGIIANLENNSLLLIDEPEISLHPNWQIEYFDILKSIVGNYFGVNAVIATHSNLLVSSLQNEESRITSILRDKESGEIKIEELDFETYGWDPESILYNVFEVATLRNKYFELDLRKLIALISTQSIENDDKSRFDEKVEIKRLKEKVEKFILSNEDDPLKLLINEVDKYLNN
jgi:predicted ATPase